MLSRFFTAHSRSAFSRVGSFFLRWPAGALLAYFLLAPATAYPQFLPGATGRIEGNDITVEGGPGAVVGTSAAVWVANGSIVTVHSGQARLLLAVGGEIDVCGPAKFTLLESGGAITLALDFGRLHLILPSTVVLQVYTPMIVATPISIAGGLRDFTLGLELSNSLCILASEGAVRLEEQFTAESVVVPQGGEFLANGIKLEPVAGPAESCRCITTDFQAHLIPASPAPLPEPGLAAPPGLVPATKSATVQPEPGSKGAGEGIHRNDAAGSPLNAVAASGAKQAPQTAPEQEARTEVEFSVPARASEVRPLPPPAKSDASPPPPVEVPMWKVFMPPLTFSSTSPAPPPDPSPQMILLIREVRVEPDWVFHGRVEAPGLVRVAERTVATTKAPAVLPAKLKVGFWAKLWRFFGGGGSHPQPCAGNGCA